MLRNWLGHADLILCWFLVSCWYGNTIRVPHQEARVWFVQVIMQDTAGLGLDPAVEVAGHVFRNTAVLPVPRQAGLRSFQRVSKLEGAVCWGLAWGLQ